MNTKIKAILVLFLFVSQVKAAGDTVKYVFTAGDAIKASEVNANFKELTDRINAVSNTTGSVNYNMSDYAIDNTISTMKFKVSNNGMGDHDTEINEYTRSGNFVIQLRKRLTGGDLGAISKCHRLTYARSAAGFDLMKREHLDSSCNTIVTAFNMADGVRMFNSTMIKGVPVGGGFEAVITGDFNGTKWGNEVVTIMGTEDVTLTVNGASKTFNNCLKIHRTRMFSSWGGNYERTSWRCAGMGAVKMIETRFRNNIVDSRKRELYETS